MKIRIPYYSDNFLILISISNSQKKLPYHIYTKKNRVAIIPTIKTKSQHNVFPACINNRFPVANIELYKQFVRGQDSAARGG